MALNIIRFLTMTMVSLSLGGAVFSFIARWEYDVSAATFMDWHRHIDYFMGKRGIFIGPPTILLLLIHTVMGWKVGKKFFFLSLLAFIAYVLGTVIAVKGNVPINLQLQALEPGNIPDDWEQIRNTWLGYHKWRNLTAIVGFFCLLTTFFLKEVKNI